MFVRIREKRLFVLGSGWSVFIEYLWAIKSGICPTVQFIDPAAIQAEAQASAQQRMNREKYHKFCGECDIHQCPFQPDTSLGAELLEGVREGKDA